MVKEEQLATKSGKRFVPKSTGLEVYVNLPIS